MLLVRILVFLLSFRGTVCLASPSSPRYELNDGPSKPIRVASRNRNGGKVKFYDLSETQNSKTDLQINLGAVSKSILPALRSTFLPTGFPDKTPPGYLQFSVWSWIQDVSTQLRSVLATQKILEGVGVGKEGATALSALFNYLVRDGCGMAANLLFTYAASSRFRHDVKRWRLFADVSVDIGITLEVAATLFPRAFFLPCICLGNMFKALCGVAAGACGGSINLHWAKGSDISDINAKFGAQHTVTGAIGLLFAGLFARSVSSVSLQTLWVMYTLLTALHIFANLRCMRLISFDYLNTLRYDMLLESYAKNPNETSLPSPREVAKTEPLWFQIPRIGRKGLPVHFGVAFDEFCKRSGKPFDWLRTNLESNRSQKSLARDGYILSLGHQNLSSDGREISKPCVVVSFLMDTSRQQHAKAYFHAWWLTTQYQMRHETSKLDLTEQLEIERQAERAVEANWNDFQERCTNAGWDLTQTELQTVGYEVEVIR